MPAAASADRAAQLAAFRARLTKPGALRLYLLRHLPLAWLGGCRLGTLTADEATVLMRHRWLNQNPFRSLYFGAQAMAAELSTGLLVMQHISGYQPGFSMLVTGLRASFSKKATGLITFTCPDGAAIAAAVEEAARTGEGRTLEVRSVGTDEAHDVVSEFWLTWSLKQRSR